VKQFERINYKSAVKNAFSHAQWSFFRYTINSYAAFNVSRETIGQSSWFISLHNLRLLGGGTFELQYPGF
jgi:hypothetical protein